MKITPQTYINRFGSNEVLLDGFRPASVNIVIPSYCEDGLLQTLESLEQCDSPHQRVCVIVVLNHPENDNRASVFHKNQMEILQQTPWNHFELYVINKALPLKHAGVGLARKVGMDEVVRHARPNDENVWLICLDADCKVSKTYLIDLMTLYSMSEAANVVIPFSHDYEAETDDKLKEGIIRYELFLRYYRYGLEYCRYPFAHHTIGSCMGTRIRNYIRGGGMNKRKAGEDFYFLGKLFLLGPTIVLKNAMVFPSCRISNRVPFGTGKAQGKYHNHPDPAYPVYHPKIFIELRKWLEKIHPGMNFTDHNLHPALTEFLEQKDFQKIIKDANENTTTEKKYFERLYRDVDVFFMLKAVHYLRNHRSEDFKDLPVLRAVEGLTGKSFNKPEEALIWFREYEKLTARYNDFFS